MSTQQPSPAPAQKPLATTKQSLDLLIHYEFVPCLIEFLRKNPPDPKIKRTILINNTLYTRKDIEDALYRWISRHPELNISLDESIKQFESPEFLNQLDQAIVNSLSKQYEKEYGSVVPTDLEGLVASHAAYLEQKGKTEGIKPATLPSLKMQIKLAVEIQQRLLTAANEKLPENYTRRIIREKTPEVLKKVVAHYQESQTSPDEKALGQIIKSIDDPEFQLVFSGKKEGQPRIRAAVGSLASLTTDPKQNLVISQAAASHQEYQNAYNLERGTRTGLGNFLVGKYGFNKDETLRILNHLETLHPGMPKNEIREELRRYLRGYEPFIQQRGFTIDQVANEITEPAKTFIELTPNIAQADNLYGPTKQIEHKAGLLGVSVAGSTLYACGATWGDIDRELKRKDLSTAEKARLIEVKQELIAFEKFKDKPESKDLSAARKETQNYAAKHHLWQWSESNPNPNGLFLFRTASWASLPKTKTYYLQQSKGFARVAFRLFPSIPNLTKVPALRRLKIISRFSLKATAKAYLKKKLVFQPLNRLAGFFVKKAVQVAINVVLKGGAKFLTKVLARVFLYLAGILFSVTTFLTSGIFTVILILKDILGLLFRPIKKLLGLERKKLGEMGLEEVGALATRPFGFVGEALGGVGEFFSPKAHLAGLGPVGWAIGDLFSLKNIAGTAVIAVIVLVFVFTILFNPLTGAFLTGYKVYKSVANLIAGLQNIGRITAANATEEMFNQLVNLGFTQEQAESIIESAKESGYLQCGRLAAAIYGAMFPGQTFPLVYNSAAEYYGNPPSGFSNSSEAVPGAIIALPARNCPSGKHCQNPQDDNYDVGCCGHMYTVIAKRESASGDICTTLQVAGDTGIITKDDIHCPTDPNSIMVSNQQAG